MINMLVLQLHGPTIGLGHLDHNMSKRSNEKEKIIHYNCTNFRWSYLTHFKSKLGQIYVCFEAWMTIFHLKKFYSKIHNGVKDMRKMLLIYQLTHIITVFFEHLLTQTQH